MEELHKKLQKELYNARRRKEVAIKSLQMELNKDLGMSSTLQEQVNQLSLKSRELELNVREQ